MSKKIFEKSPKFLSPRARHRDVLATRISRFRLSPDYRDSQNVRPTLWDDYFDYGLSGELFEFDPFLCIFVHANHMEKFSSLKNFFFQIFVLTLFQSIPTIPAQGTF